VAAAAADERDELAPSKANAYLALPCEPVDQAADRGSTDNWALPLPALKLRCLKTTGRRLYLSKRE
jgi:hypothetical protein